MSIDVTNACNLECAGCYYYSKSWEENMLTVSQWIEKIREIKHEHPGIVHCTWVGGEPMLRKDLLVPGIQEFDLNWIVTNGTVPFPDWRERVIFAVSIDGPKAYHDNIRSVNRPGSMWERTRKNVLAAKTQRIFIHTVLNRNSWQNTEELLRDWIDTNVIGIRFSLYTPLPGVNDPLWIPWEDRVSLVKRLLRLKHIYGKFMVQTEAELKLFLPELSKAVVGENCLLKRGATISLDTAGNKKLPCVMGEMDCDRCGCTIPYMTHIVLKKHNVGAMLAATKTVI